MLHWLRSYVLLLRWTVLRLRFLLPLVLIVQTLLAVGIVVGFSYLMPVIDPTTALFLSTGAPTQGLIIIGMVLAPQFVAQAKTDGTFTYNRTLPVPRTAVLVADLTVWLLSGAPGLILALFAAVWRFDLKLHVSPLVVLAAALVALTSTAVGYALAYASKPAVANLMSQVIVFVALMFSPINFPTDRLPEWLALAQRVLPFQYMAQAVRDSLTLPTTAVSVTPFAVLGIWCVVALTITVRVMTRRD